MSVDFPQYKCPWIAPVMTCNIRRTMKQWVPTQEFDVADKATRIPSDHSPRVSYGYQSLLVPGADSFFHAPKAAQARREQRVAVQLGDVPVGVGVKT